MKAGRQAQEAVAAFTGYSAPRMPGDSGSILSLATDTSPSPAFALFRYAQGGSGWNSRMHLD